MKIIKIKLKRNEHFKTETICILLQSEISIIRISIINNENGVNR